MSRISATNMLDFRHRYIVLGFLFIAGVAGSLVTPLGGDPRVGNISTGIAISSLVALYLLRTAQIRSNAHVGPSNFDFHAREAPRLTERLAEGSQRFQPPVIEQPQQQAHTPVQACECVCDCQNEALNGFEGMCDSCRIDRVVQSLDCDCDYTQLAYCVCGAVEHQPAAAGKGAEDLQKISA